MDNIQNLYEFFLQHPFVSTDTRSDVSNSIFFALSGESFNGNRFAEQAIQKGAKLAVIDDEKYFKGDGYFLVEDVLTALQNLARIHRANNKIPLLGITGSNGKTTTKELISAVLSSSKSIISTQGNLNNHIGVPLTVLRIKPETEIAVVEMGANHIGEIKLLCDIARPDTGIITNIGKAHLEGFGSLEGVITAKSELYQSLKSSGGKAFVNADDELLMRLTSGFNRLTYGSSNSDVTGQIISLKPFLSLSWKYRDKQFVVNTKLYGKYNFPNIMAAISVGIFFDIEPEKINKAISQYTSENNRSQQLATASNKIILDAYNANPVSMSEAIRSFSEAGFENPFLILGDMFELGKVAGEEHQKIVDQLLAAGFENVILVGKEFNKLNTPEKFTVLPTTVETAKYLQNKSVKNSNILIKGSRGMKLETLLTFL
jgi:UDP-N-acetylmuramoyl-tripeptide--D-alanyl-D-alanine ligase